MQKITIAKNSIDEALARRVHDAARDGDLSLLQSVPGSRPEAVEIENADGEAPLVTAAAQGNTASVKLLLENGGFCKPDDPQRGDGVPGTSVRQ